MTGLDVRYCRLPWMGCGATWWRWGMAGPAKGQGCTRGVHRCLECIMDASVGNPCSPWPTTRPAAQIGVALRPR